MAEPMGLQGDIPAALICIEATAEQVHPPMRRAIRIRDPLLTIMDPENWTTT